MSAKTALILGSNVGHSNPMYDRILNIPADLDYTKGRVQEANETYYLVYNEANFHKGNPNNEVLRTGYRIVKSTNFKEFGGGFVARSALGINMNGCALFEYRYFSGEHHNFRDSCRDLSMFFTTNHEGISSIIVSQGKWALYTGRNFTGTRIEIGGKDTFGSGYQCAYIGAGEDKVLSLELIQD